MVSIKPLCQVILAGLDYERIKHSLSRLPAYRYYLIENVGAKDKKEEELVERIHETLESRLKRWGYTDRFFWYGINFSNLSEALVQIYELLLREKKAEKEVFVNVSTGTKPIAIVASIAAALAECGVVYFPAGKYDKRGGEVVAIGVREDPISIQPEAFKIQKSLSDVSDVETEIILELLEIGKIEKVSQLANRKKQSKVPSYHYHLKNLADRKLVKFDRDGIELTKLGRLTAAILKVRKRLEI